MKNLKEQIEPRYVIKLVDPSNDALVKAALFSNPNIKIKRVDDTLEIRVKGAIDPVIKALSRVEVLKLDQQGGDLEELLKTFYSEVVANNE